MADRIDTPVALIDSRECALIVWVDKDGVANAHANGCTKEYGAHALRYIANQWDPERDGDGFAPLTEDDRDGVAGELMRRWGCQDDDEEAYDSACRDVDTLLEAISARGYRLLPPRSTDG